LICLIELEFTFLTERENNAKSNDIETSSKKIVRYLSSLVAGYKIERGISEIRQGSMKTGWIATPR